VRRSFLGRKVDHRLAGGRRIRVWSCEGHVDEEFEDPAPI
jgi:hypothetical protein